MPVLNILKKRSSLSCVKTQYLQIFFAALVTVIWISCGDPTDKPEDCTTNEYFDDVDKLCITCPALTDPQCREGCGFTIVKDERGCPEALCSETCDLCEEGTSFSDETLQCEPDDA